MAYPPNPYQQANGYQQTNNGEGQKSFIATWLLSWFLGGLGIDRFYLGKIGTGILKLITIGGFGIWYLIDVILILAGAMRDKAGYKLQGYEQHKKIAWIITIILFLLSAGIGANNASEYMNQLQSI